MRTIIAGSRTISDEKMLYRAVCECGWQVTTVISGGARGADKLGERFAEEVFAPLEVFPADWSRGINAGFERNAHMASIADAAIVLWDGVSKGSQHMIQTMRSLGKPVYVMSSPQALEGLHQTPAEDLPPVRGIFWDDHSERANLLEDMGRLTSTPAHKLPLLTKIQNVGLTHSTVLADLDFEVYSEAGYYFDAAAKNGLGQWRIIPGAPKGCSSGLSAVGAVNYAAHPTTEVLMMAYDLKDGMGSRLWLPGMPPPLDLFAYIERGGLVAAWNSSFEYWTWKYVCTCRMGWPELPFWQLRDDMAKAMAFGLPAKLEYAGTALDSDEQKDKDGMRLINKFSKPQNPLKSKPNRMRIFVQDEPVDGPKFCGYNVQDIVSEASIAALCPDLSTHEEQVWLCDQAINVRGIQIDLEAVDAFIELVEQAQVRYRTELQQITDNVVMAESKAKDMRLWCNERGAGLSCLDEDAVDAELEREDLAPNVRRVLEIRQLLSSAAVKKLFTMRLKTGPDGRMHDVFSYCGAQKTSRWAGRDIQPQNLPAKSLKVAKCRCCGHIKLAIAGQCVYCGDLIQGQDPHPWDDEAVNEVIRVAKQGDLDTFQEHWGDPLTAISACIRGLLTCAPCNDLICSDFSAIEAVVLAFMSGCQWRIDVFNTHGKIYEMSAAKISGIPFEEIMASAGYLDTTSPEWWDAIVEGVHHHLRKTIGKVAELASGYHGWIGAWCNFGADKFMNNDEMKKAILKWREDSPEIVEFWGGQYRRTGYRQTKPELYGVEGCAIAAVLNPGTVYQFRELQFGVKDNILFVRLPSGRSMTYHEPELYDTTDPLGIAIKQLTFMGVCPKSKKWVRRDTYGGRMTENIIQAVARDIQANGIVQLEKAGYSVVIHVHDEIISEVKQGTGSVEHFESIMSTMPDWCAHWPVKAKGGWRGMRYKKD